MTNLLESTPPPPPPATPVPPPPASTPAPAPRASEPPQRTRTGWHVLAIVLGCLALVPGLAMFVGGVGVAVGQEVITDDDGYFRVTLDRVESEGVAIAATELFLDDADIDVDIDDATGFFDWVDLDVRLRVDGTGSSDDVFVGIGRTADVEAYLALADYSEVASINDRTVDYRRVEGSDMIDSPLDQDFWVASSDGTGEQVLTWQARRGDWSAVVMNSDGSPGVVSEVEVGARTNVISSVAVGVLLFGAVLTVIGIVFIVAGIRGRRPRRRIEDQPMLPLG